MSQQFEQARQCGSLAVLTLFSVRTRLFIIWFAPISSWSACMRLSRSTTTACCGARRPTPNSVCALPPCPELAEATRVVRPVSAKPNSVAGASFNLVRIVRKYVESFARTNPVEAFHYLFLLSEPKAQRSSSASSVNLSRSAARGALFSAVSELSQVVDRQLCGRYAGRRCRDGGRAREQAQRAVAVAVDRRRERHASSQLVIRSGADCSLVRQWRRQHARR